MPEGKNIVAFAGVVAAMPTVEQHASTVSSLIRESGLPGVPGLSVCEPAHDMVLPPEGDLVMMRDELARALAPAGQDRADCAMEMLLGAYREPALVDPEIFAASFVEDLSEYPVDILVAMVREVRRTHKFFPTIAE